MSVNITFLGAAGTVTGSKYLVEGGGKRILIDCGLFQGDRFWRDHNWQEPPIALDQIDAVLLTHAHIDHTGMLPRYYSLGMRCPVFCSAATLDLAQVLLMDSAKLQEEEVEYRSARGRSRHAPVLPLYQVADAQGVLSTMRSVPNGRSVSIVEGVEAQWQHMGHIIGACSISLTIAGKRIVFSGDIGRYNVPILRDPLAVPLGDLVLIEGTYGDKLHPEESPAEPLARIINETVKRKGLVLIPSFAVGRTQSLLFYIRQLKEARRIPDIPIIIDSPMAADATEIYVKNVNDYDEQSMEIVKDGKNPFRMPKLAFVRDRNQSIKLNSITDPMVLISASGMLNGGRILHHLKHRVSNPANTVLLVGYQPKGGRGDWLRSGAPTMRLMGEDVPVRAHVAEIGALSAHGDRDELLRWGRECNAISGAGLPGKVALVHSEPEVAEKFEQTLKRELKWNVWRPKYLERYAV